MSPRDDATPPRLGDGQHLDEDTIALAALGEPLDARDDDHLVGCDRCWAQVDALGRVVTVARSTRAVEPETLTAPPAHVWAAITAELGLDLPADEAVAPARHEAGAPTSEPVTLPTEPPTEPLAEPVPLRPRPPATGTPPVVPAQPQRPARRPAWLLAAACVAGLAVGAGGTLAYQAITADADVVATAALQPLEDQEGTGEAEVVDTADGRELELSLETPTPPDAFLQVWLLSSDATRMVPVGVLVGREGHWTIPSDVALDDFSVVDVSVEPYDGDPAHSGVSIVRGALSTASAVGPLGRADG